MRLVPKRYVAMVLPVALLACGFGQPALAMPNPGETKPYTDHSKPIGLGAEYASQHYADVSIQPKGNGKFVIAISCENGERGGNTDAVFTATLKAGDEVVQTVNRECHLSRVPGYLGFIDGTGHQRSTATYDFDLSKVIDRVTSVTFTAKQIAPTTRPPDRPLGCYPAPCSSN